MEISDLPEECICHIISLTSPKDACRLSVVSPFFKSASDSDSVWEKFLPNDYRDLVSRRSVFDPMLDSMPKKALFLYLSDHPIIIDNGTMSFSLEKQSGKKCFMVAARGLQIIWGETSNYWAWKSLPMSRFAEVAHLNYVCWLEINATVETNMLSPETTYGAYFVYKFAEAEEEEEAEHVHWFNLLQAQRHQVYGFDRRPVQLRVDFEGQENRDTRSVFLDPRVNVPPLPRGRGDGWMEVEVGEFCGDDGLVICGLKEVDDYNSKGCLIVEGIEIRPKA